MVRFAWRDVVNWRTFTAEEVSELAGRVAGLSRAGLPLGPGLRALADELPGRRMPCVIRKMADRLDAGDDLVTALEAQGRRLPAHFRGLMLAGVRCGRLPEVLEEYVDIEREQMELRHRIWVNLAYPFLLLVFMTGLTVAARLYLIDGFRQIYQGFGTTLPTMTTLVFQLSGPLAWGSTALVVVLALFPLILFVMPGAGWIWPLLYRMPLVGPMCRWSHLSEFSRLMGLLLEQNVTVPDALRLSAAGLRNAQLAWGCRNVAKEVEAGRKLSESMADRKPFPPSMVPMVQWGQQTPALAEVFRAAAEMFEGRVQAHSAVMQSILLPVMFLAVFLFIWIFVVLALLLPLVSLIQRLT